METNMVNWYYVIGSERVGPVSVSALKVLFSTGEISNDTYIWKKGFANWERLKDVTELKLDEIEMESAPAPAPTRPAPIDQPRRVGRWRAPHSACAAFPNRAATPRR